MAVIKPFRGMRFDTEKAGELKTLCCPPYDIISEEQRKAFIAQNPYNVIRLELPKEGDDVYERAGEVLDLWRDKGVLVYEDKPAIYVYEMEFNAYNKRKRVKGLIARVKVEEFSKGVILPHEFTLSKAKEDRLNLMKATNCNFSQIYALYMDSEHTTLQTIDAESTADAAYAFTDDDNITHRLWVVTDEKVIEKLCADFADRKLYIADGHHRYETALNYRNYCRENGISKEGDGQDYQMIYLVDMEHPGLVVFPTHRMVRDLPDFSKYNVLAGCEPYFEIEKYTAVGNMNTLLAEKYNQGKKAFAFYCGKGEWYLLTLKDIGVMSKVLPDVSEASQQLDVSVLHSLIVLVYPQPHTRDRDPRRGSRRRKDAAEVHLFLSQDDHRHGDERHRSGINEAVDGLYRRHHQLLRSGRRARSRQPKRLLSARAGKTGRCARRF